MKTSFDEIQQLKQELAMIKQDHRELDIRIDQMIESLDANQLEIKRLKKRKLQLKDRIARIESTLIPDLLA